VCRDARIVRSALLWLAIVSSSAQPLFAQARSLPKRSITVSDTVVSTQFVTQGDRVEGRRQVASFSPSRRQFVLVLKKANLKKGANQFSLLSFYVGDVFRSPKPSRLLTMSSTSNREAISRVRWLSEEVLCFLGENPGESSQVYFLDVRRRKLKQITNHATPITNYDITPDGRTLLFMAQPPDAKEELRRRTRKEPLVIQGQELSDVISVNNSSSRWADQRVFLKRTGRPTIPIHVPEQYRVEDLASLALSPNGRYAVVGVGLQSLPASWNRYEIDIFKQYASVGHRKGDIAPAYQALVYDSDESSLTPVLNAPSDTRTGRVVRARWAADSRSLFLRSYLPLDVSDGVELEARLKNAYAVSVAFPSRRIQKITEQDWPAERGSKDPVAVEVMQSLNSPPKVCVSDRVSGQQALLLDPNPQFDELDFGRTEAVEWKVRGSVEVRGGLYLPPDYTPGRKYPLVIQTHGFEPGEFSMDGLHEWASGYAARALAAQGVIALQAFQLKHEAEGKDIAEKKKFGVTRSQAWRNLEVSAYEAAIDYLDERGMIDRDRIGIVGFSRTVCFVAYMLTHSSYHLGAAALVDGIDCGYFQELAFPQLAWDFAQINGGATPFGVGLKDWFRESPSFSLDKVEAPVLLLALNPSGVLSQWEWYAGLSLQDKPVDFLVISVDDDDDDGSNHLLVKPWERLRTQQSLVDWFCFWLKGEENRGGAQNKQHVRWEELRERQSRSRRMAVPANE
jgi:dipeptidyl aminopeptidase/acylaminoacyl peptidase